MVWLGEIPKQAPPPEWAAFRRRHAVIGIRVEDEWERSGPTAQGFTAYDPAAGQLTWMTASSQSRSAHAAWRAEREAIWNAWWPGPADRLTVAADADPLAALVRFLRTRGDARPGFGLAAP